MVFFDKYTLAPFNKGASTVYKKEVSFLKRVSFCYAELLVNLGVSKVPGVTAATIWLFFISSECTVQNVCGPECACTKHVRYVSTIKLLH